MKFNEKHTRHRFRLTALLLLDPCIVAVVVVDDECERKAMERTKSKKTALFLFF
jgi:hypothetical protein